MTRSVDHSQVRSRRFSRGRLASSLLIATICGVAAALGCSDHGAIAPLVIRGSSNGPLPSSPRYIIELEVAGKAPPAVVAYLASAGGRILWAHAGIGMLIVSGLSAKAATALQHVSGVRNVMPDVKMRLIHELPMRHVATPRGWHPSAHSVVARGGDPANAEFYPQQWNMTQVEADSAWHYSSQGAGEKVFILDTGIDTAHIDLKGLVDIPLCTSFAYATDTSTNPLPFSHDVVGHGTFVSSIITSNSLGIAAVAPQAQVVMVRVLDDSGEGTASALISGLLYASDSGAKIINMSLGGYFDRTSDTYLAIADFYQRVVDYVVQRGAILVAAAGNESVNTNTAMSPSGSYVDSLNTPAGLHHVLSVGATGPIDQQYFDSIAAYSNYGDAGVGVFAPGGNIVHYGTAVGDSDLVIGACSSATTICADSEDEYVGDAGTSFASPMAAGEAAVVQAQQGGAISGGSLEMCVLVSATEVTGKRPDVNYNYGRIDVYSALKNSSCKSGT
jgi:lantibiotic leader peptide-processing serine protease